MILYYKTTYTAVITQNKLFCVISAIALGGIKIYFYTTSNSCCTNTKGILCLLLFVVLTTNK